MLATSTVRDMSIAQTSQTIETRSAAETEALAARIGAAITRQTLVTLSGELGAGKTVFVRGLARGLGVPVATPVTSPTYVLLHHYRGGRLMLYHIDAYRLGGGADEFEASGLNECLADPNGVVCIEWPEKLTGQKWPQARIEVSIEHIDPDVRRIVVSGVAF
jgi:tRNA threonylcarbamoyladenosine biosynthesis protein TsaE